jgi:hypothetical protein
MDTEEATMAVRMSACGIVCSDCGAYIAQQKGDPAYQAEVAAAWKRIFNLDVPPEALSCAGCTSLEGQTFSSCQDCFVRQCALAKGIAHCGLCDDFPCAEFNRVQAQYDHLDQMAERLSEDDFARYVAPYCEARERLAAAVRRPWDWS